ncbi:hypothetical protein SAMN00790413_05757 [Deinococcus hopiensis KR-140]|uniref:Uncharacterized protein n=1 Tax=Deinococcus hopiensis KR-140 TaxID=695939 RepID=A0A1W1UDB8_9DEIO|nr:hypothetical protein SAMN00790413_05757 [Deinococcus hopiensis KR-140]
MLAGCGQPSLTRDAPTARLHPQALSCGQATVNWSGYTWTVRNSTGGLVGPGPNIFDPNNVCVDSSTGTMRLSLSNPGGQWRSAELTTQQSLGVGTYTWNMIGDFTTIDPNVVLGLFPYSTVPPVGARSADGFKEQDIEFARWGVPGRGPINYTVYPGTVMGQNTLTGDKQSFHYEYAQSLSGTYTTHRMTRTATSVMIEGFHGHTTALSNRFRCVKFSAVNNAGSLILRTDVRIGSGALTTTTVNKGAGLSAADFISAESMPLHMNLWLFQGAAPRNGQTTSFSFTNFTFSTTPVSSSC